jgi:hypothetical protein
MIGLLTLTSRPKLPPGSAFENKLAMTGAIVYAAAKRITPPDRLGSSLLRGWRP